MRQTEPMPVVDVTSSAPLARRFAALLEPVIGQVYFSPECHANYVELGFNPSPGFAGKTALPDGPAYFTSRGSVMGHVPGEVVAAAFAVFNPAAVVPSVAHGWSITDAPTICAARDAGALAQMSRVLGDDPGAARAGELLSRMTVPLRPEGRPLYAGLRSLAIPDHPWGIVWREGDRLREFRGDSHTASWVAAGLDPMEIGLLTEGFMGLGFFTYLRTRAWSEADVNAALSRLRDRGLIDDTALTADGHAFRDAIEAATDAQMQPALDALGNDAEELFAILKPWGAAMRATGGYLGGGAGDLGPKK
jgi:hypothetical protein